MSISLNPLDIFKLWSDRKHRQWESFAEWLTQVQEEAQALLQMWSDIRKNLETSGRADAWEAYIKTEGLLNLQMLEAGELQEFYKYASTAAEGRLNEGSKETLVLKMAVAIGYRRSAREQLESVLKDALHKELFYLDNDNRVEKMDSLLAAIEKLQRELVALNVFIETMKANPKAFT